MAAIPKPIAMTAGALKFDKPVDLDDALLAIEKLKAAIEVGLKQIGELQDRADGYAEECDQLRADKSDLEATIDEQEQEIEDTSTAVELAESARQYVMAGRTAEALHALETLLQTMDPQCKRTAIVVLPMAGSFAA